MQARSRGISGAKQGSCCAWYVKGALSGTLRTDRADKHGFAQSGDSVAAIVASVNRGQPLSTVRTMEAWPITPSPTVGSNGCCWDRSPELCYCSLQYGVISYVVTQRYREIGLRMASVASGGCIVRTVVRHGMLLTGSGLAIGLAASWALTRLMKAYCTESRPQWQEFPRYLLRLPSRVLDAGGVRIDPIGALREG